VKEDIEPTDSEIRRDIIVFRYWKESPSKPSGERRVLEMYSKYSETVGFHIELYDEKFGEVEVTVSEDEEEEINEEGAENDGFKIAEADEDAGGISHVREQLNMNDVGGVCARLQVLVQWPSGLLYSQALRRGRPARVPRLHTSRCVSATFSSPKSRAIGCPPCFCRRLRRVRAGLGEYS